MKMLDVVTTMRDFPDQNVTKGQVGTIIEELDTDTVLVEFADANGVPYAISPTPVESLIVLSYSQAAIAA